MRIGRSNNPTGKTQVVVLTADSEFADQVRQTFGATDQIVLRLVSGSLAALAGEFDLDDATVVVIDFDVTRAQEMEALELLMARIGSWPPVIAVTQSFDAGVARTLVQMRISDFLVKPVSSVELVRTCARAAKGQPAADATE